MRTKSRKGLWKSNIERNRAAAINPHENPHPLLFWISSEQRITPFPHTPIQVERDPTKTQPLIGACPSKLKTTMAADYLQFSAHLGPKSENSNYRHRLLKFSIRRVPHPGGAWARGTGDWSCSAGSQLTKIIYSVPDLVTGTCLCLCCRWPTGVLGQDIDRWMLRLMMPGLQSKVAEDPKRFKVSRRTCQPFAATHTRSCLINDWNGARDVSGVRASGGMLRFWRCFNWVPTGPSCHPHRPKFTVLSQFHARARFFNPLLSLIVCCVCGSKSTCLSTLWMAGETEKVTFFVVSTGPHADGCLYKILSR